MEVFSPAGDSVTHEIRRDFTESIGSGVGVNLGSLYP